MIPPDWPVYYRIKFTEPEPPTLVKDRYNIVIMMLFFYCFLSFGFSSGMNAEAAYSVTTDWNQ